MKVKMLSWPPHTLSQKQNGAGTARVRFKTRATAIASLSARICAVPARKCVPMSGAHDLSVSNGTPKTVSNTLPGRTSGISFRKVIHRLRIRFRVPQPVFREPEPLRLRRAPVERVRGVHAKRLVSSSRVRALVVLLFFDASASVASPNTFARSVADISSTRCRNATCPGWNAATGKTPSLNARNPSTFALESSRGKPKPASNTRVGAETSPGTSVWWSTGSKPGHSFSRRVIALNTCWSEVSRAKRASFSEAAPFSESSVKSRLHALANAFAPGVVFKNTTPVLNTPPARRARRASRPSSAQVVARHHHVRGGDGRARKRIRLWDCGLDSKLGALQVVRRIGEPHDIRVGHQDVVPELERRANLRDSRRREALPAVGGVGGATVQTALLKHPERRHVPRH